MEVILDEDWLYRRIAPGFVATNGTISASAYKVSKKPDPEVSVELARLTTANQALSRAPKPGYQIGQLQAKVPRALDLSVEHDPLVDNYAHALIIGNSLKYNCGKMAEATTLVTAIEDQTS